jgi:hypothetical protein
VFLACPAGRSLTSHLDGFHRFPIERLRAVVAAGAAEEEGGDLDRLDCFTHYTCPSLPHLIALLCRPTAACIPQGTALVVIDSLSALVNHAFPKLPETRPSKDAKGSKGMPLLARTTCPETDVDIKDPRPRHGACRCFSTLSAASRSLRQHETWPLWFLLNVPPRCRRNAVRP